MMRWLVFAFAAVSLSACATYKNDLARGQDAYEARAYPRALAVFRGLEADSTRLDPVDRTRYAFLRGMTDNGMGYRSDARHWLVLAKALESENPGALPSEWKTRLEEAITALNEAVYQGGIGSLTNTLTTKNANDDEPAEAAPSPKKKAKSEDEP